METARISYVGQLRTNAVHLKSSTEIITDAPTDNHGKGEAFSPTDLLATALGSCMLTIMGIKANEHGFQLLDATASITKEMAADPRRVAQVRIDITIPDLDYTAEQKFILHDAAINCPVAKSLSESLKQTVTFTFEKV